MPFYIIVFLEKKDVIGEAKEKIAELSIHEGEGQEEKAGGKFPEILRSDNSSPNCNQ